MTPIRRPAIRSARILSLALGRALVRFNRKGGWVTSSHVGMSLLMALFPFLIFLTALAGAFTTELQADRLIALVLSGWPEQIADPIRAELAAVLAADNGGLITLGGALALIFASNGVNAVRHALVRSYRGEDRRPLWHQRLLALIFVLVWAAVLFAVAMLELGLPIYMELIGATARAGLLFSDDLPRQMLALALLLFGVGACHLWLPERRRSLSQIWPGIALTVLLWAIAAELFAIYVARYAEYSTTYAGLAGAMSALIFLYLMSAILILGAEMNGALDTIRSRQPD